MTEVDITDPRYTAEGLVICYLTQLLARTGRDVRRLCGGRLPRGLAIRNRIFYNPWLSCAKLDIVEESEGRLQWDWSQTESALGVEEWLRNASQKDINSYLVWVRLSLLLAHADQDIRSLCGGFPPRELATRNSVSYQLWLSYAKLEIVEESEGHLQWDWSQTESTSGIEEYLRNASQVEINSYLAWVFPRAIVEGWGVGHPGSDLRCYVSPVHIRFFRSDCYRQPAIRPIANAPQLADLFCHPVLLVRNYDGPPPFVVPVQFVNAAAPSNPSPDYKSVSYYLFPLFAQKLFDWANDPNRSGTFSTHYFAQESAWLSETPHDSEKDWLVPPRPLLKKSWRWQEVMEMLEEQVGQGDDDESGSRLKCCSYAYGLSQMPTVVRYLDSFGDMAVTWLKGSGTISKSWKTRYGSAAPVINAAPR